MNYKPLGNSGISASVVGLGAWVLGGGQLWGQDTDDAESIRAIQKAIDLGINLIDTAPAYGFGRSEVVVGKAIKGRRDKVVIATKGGLWWDDARGSFFANFDGKKVYRSLRPDTLRIEVENSLKRLGVDCIDLYQTHWPSAPPDFTPIADTMAALLAFKDQGKIRALGVSNVSLAEMKENIRCGHVVSDQLRYSMLNRGAEKDILPFCAQNQVATLTYMSLEQGLLTGKIGMDRVFKPERVPRQCLLECLAAPGQPPPGARSAGALEGVDGQVSVHSSAACARVDGGPAGRHSRPGRRPQYPAGDRERQSRRPEAGARGHQAYPGGRPGAGRAGKGLSRIGREE